MTSQTTVSAFLNRAPGLINKYDRWLKLYINGPELDEIHQIDMLSA